MSVTEPNRPPLVRLQDYVAPAWRMQQVELEFDLGVELTLVLGRLHLVQDPLRGDAELRLDGVGLELLGVRLDGRDLETDQYRIEGNDLYIPTARGSAVIETRSRIRPVANTALQGLYLSGSREGGFLLTQCEAEGFRHITWAIDRPDVLARYTVTLRADRSRFPVLLAGGDPSGAGALPDGRHWVRYVDPFPRPSYLFALVAGQLSSIEDTHLSAEGRRIRLAIWAQSDNVDRCHHAMECLKSAIAWDERAFGRCYQLDAFHIVVTDDFTNGAMENTGLNIFNAKYLLADPMHATDEDYRHVLAVVAHEYFHNWTGNRVTCRDWFQLSLKEGLTVYREQEFESDIASRTLRRIEDVRSLWRSQFAEDAGPLAHPVRPEQYSEINNFYTTTIYDKGAEIVRMLATRLGQPGFRRGMDLYFERHDGSAVTVEDFLAALGDANEVDLGAWLGWYRQVGTPVLEARGHYDPRQRTYVLNLRQETRATPGQTPKRVLPIPVAVALFDAHGNRLPTDCASGEATPDGDHVLLLQEPEADFVFRDVGSRPIPSLLRGYSAPVRLVADSDWRSQAVLAAHETDGFNRWHAADAMARSAFAIMLGGDIRPDAGARAWVECLRSGLADRAIDPATVAEMLTVADTTTLAEPLPEFDPDAVHQARWALESLLARALEAELLECHAMFAAASSAGMQPLAQAQRRLRNQCLHLLCVADPGHLELARLHYANASCLSDRMIALTCSVHRGGSGAGAMLDEFFDAYRDAPSVIDKWFSVQATVAAAATVERVRDLTVHPAFRWDNPNKVHALLAAFAQRNPVAFHRIDGAGYRLVAEAVRRLDHVNPQVAARLATAFGTWQRLEPRRREAMRSEMIRLGSAGPLSADVADILGRSLGGS